MLHVERLFAQEGLRALEPEWAQIEHSIRPRTPFTSPLWNALWWKHFAIDTAWVRDELCLYAVRNEFDALIAIAPMMLTCRPARGPLRVRGAQLLGADENVTELRGIVCRPEHQLEALDALNRHFQSTSRQWDWLKWSGIPAAGASRELLERGGRIRWDREIPNYYLALPQSWDALRAGLSRNMREALRKCYNAPRRAGLDLQFRIAATPAEIEAALPVFFTLHEARSLVMVPAHPNAFARPIARAFLTDYALQMAHRGQARIFELTCGTHIVASRVGFAFGPDLYLYYSGFRPRWAPYSVMTRLVAETLRWAIGQGFERVDLSTGRDPSKLRWRPVEVTTLEGVQSSPRRLGGIAAGAYRHLVGRARPDTVLGRLLRPARRSRL